jgi:hypothetical protein
MQPSIRALQPVTRVRRQGLILLTCAPSCVPLTAGSLTVRRRHCTKIVGVYSAFTILTQIGGEVNTKTSVLPTSRGFRGSE